MRRMPQFTLRRLLVAIAVLEVVLAVVRSPFRFIETWQRFARRSREGERLIATYRSLGPRGSPA
jgi:hypothetical protein